jgi:replicative DNA helicase
MTKPFGARKYSEILREGLKYIDDRRKGRIKSFKTPWMGINQAGVGGLEWGSMITIGARPGSGKTLIVNQILREAKQNNPTQDFNILDFQFEMGGKQSAARAFAAETALDYNVVLSTNKDLDDFSFKMMEQYVSDTEAMEKIGIVRQVISEPLTHEGIRKAVEFYYHDLGGKPMIITIDHSWLIRKMPDEKEKISTLYNTVEMLMQLKNKFPIIVVMITQLNRGMEDYTRKTPGIIANYPTSTDIFGGDALMQGSDLVLALSRPFTLNIPLYGDKGYIVKPDDIFVHLLKVRNGSDNNTMLFMKAEFNRQRMIEVSEPTPSNPTGARGNGYTRLSQRQTGSNQPSPAADIDVDDI